MAKREREIANLHSHSAYSFSDGVCTPEEIVQAAIDKGLRSVALTDHGSCHGLGRMYLAAKKAGVKPLLGMEAYTINDFDEWRDMKEQIAITKHQEVEEVDLTVPVDELVVLDKAAIIKAQKKVLYRKGHLVLLAQNAKGLANIYQLQYLAHSKGYYQKPRVDKKFLAAHSEGVLASSACMGGVISQKLWGLQKGEVEWVDVVREANEFADIFPGRFFLELQSNESAGQRYINEHLIRLSKETGLPLNVTMDAHYVDPEDWRTQQILHLLMTHRGKSGITLNNLPPDYSFDVHSLFIKSGDELWDSFLRLNPEVDELTLERAFDNTLMADSMIENFELDVSTKLPSLPYPDTFKELYVSAAQGLKDKGLSGDDRYMERLAYELGIIKEKGLANYFLVVRNICDSARKEMLIGPGRGSSAGSLICYLTGITNIDPIEHKLMFERFINTDRCFAEGTMVMASGKLKPIESVIPGETVLTHLGNTKTVLDIFSYKKNESLIGIVYDESVFLCTTNHRLLVRKTVNGDNVFLEAGEVLTLLDDNVELWMAGEESSIRIDDAVVIPYNGNVYDLCVADDHTYQVYGSKSMFISSY